VFLDPTLEYVLKTNPFPNAQAARQGKLALASFNDEYDNAINNGMEPPHPRLDERIVSQTRREPCQILLIKIYLPTLRHTSHVYLDHSLQATMAINLRLFDVSTLLEVFPELENTFTQEYHDVSVHNHHILSQVCSLMLF